VYYAEMDEGRKRVILSSCYSGLAKVISTGQYPAFPCVGVRDSRRDCFCRADYAGDWYRFFHSSWIGKI